MIEMVPAKPQHIATIARRLRNVDRWECEAMGHDPKSALRTGLLGATIAWTAMIDGRPEAMCGVTPLSVVEGCGQPWLLMTDCAARQHKALLRLGWIYTQALHRHYPTLENWVHADNSQSIRWLSRLGFAIGATDVIRGHPMRPFVRHA